MRMTKTFPGPWMPLVGVSAISDVVDGPVASAIAEGDIPRFASF